MVGLGWYPYGRLQSDGRTTTQDMEQKALEKELILWSEGRCSKARV